MFRGKGGCCKHPYGGRVNPSRIDYAEWVYGPECINSGQVTGLQLLACTVISHAASEYEFFGLGRNGYDNVSLFFDAVNFFFHTRSYAPETWEHSPSIPQIVVDDRTGKRIAKRLLAPPDTLRLQCFDKYFELSGIGNKMSMEDFLEQLKDTRRSLLSKDKSQVKEFMELYRRNGLPLPRGQMVFDMDAPNYMDVMVYPSSPEEIEELLLPTVSLERKAPSFHRPYFPGLWKRPRSNQRRIHHATGQGSFRFRSAV